LGSTPTSKVTERIAQEGYVAIAPALFQRFAPVLKHTQKTLKLAKLQAKTKAELLGDIQATIDYLKDQPK